MTLRIFVTVLLLSACSFAQAPQPDNGAGTRPGAFSPRSLGLGHTFLTNQMGSAALMGNPATLADQTSRWNLGFNADVSRIKETRSYPFYDAFDGVLGYNNYALNDHVYSKLDGGAAYRLKQDKLESMVVSVGTYSAYQFGYKYHEEVRNRFTSGGVQDLILGQNILEVEGDLRAYSLGAAAAEGKMALGFSLSFLSGDWGYVNGVYFASPDSLDLVNRVDYTPDGTPADLNFGGTYDINPRVRVGARALFPTGDLKYKFTSIESVGDTTSRFEGTSTVKYPSHLAVGVQYRPQNEFRPQVYFETEMHTFSEVSDDLNDVLEFRAGAEQQIVPGTPARFGLVYSTSPTDRDRASALFTAGIGFILRNMRADFGLEFGEMNYASDDLFPQALYGETNRDDRDRVETAVFRGMISLAWEL
ncbi:MAG: hypothetical protein IPP40_08445 [bacterium]|nr:hypothetical protein [bacterium]